MKEELTTAMHSEFIDHEISEFDLRIMGVYGAIARGVKRKDAFLEYSLSESEYEKHICRVLHE
ncbi:hypothetical protein M2480_001442 [Parabacteroides sp. PFB2-12]|uniref:hypothetical protein n=1 Tax=unclassified Parabacteroides TaxID=2649774 RepID=UPI0024737E8B|nr:MULTISPECIES: hypothetical protein [unclassified Parabacteroides]MDH6342903.1 hypothetical protein [Parabacteroides sp. PM6-13]MDH6390467.1 hypothetical protein [Parabacteroides sp. PFB2-12]